MPFDGVALDSSWRAGRSKPELVAPLPVDCAAATAAVSSAATLLYESATGGGVKNEVLKATLLAGATKRNFPTGRARRRSP